MSSLIAEIQRSLQHAVSGDKYRYRENHWDLDLTYITPRLIAMGIPGDGVSSNWRNNIKEVSNFFYQKHHGHFLIINLSGDSYNYSLFDNQVVDFAFPDHHPPPLELYLSVLKKMRDWLLADPLNIVAVHCLAGRSRTGTIIAGYLLYSSFCENALQAISYFNNKRSFEAKDVCLPSQLRYVGYMDSLLQDHERRALKHPQTRILRAVIITPPFRLEGSVSEGKAFWKPHLRLLRQDLPQETLFRKTYPTVGMSDTNSVRLDVPNIALTGDVLLKLSHVATNPISYGRVCMKIQKVAEAATSLDSDLIVDVARISLHTSFMEEGSETSFYSFEIDAHKAGPIAAGSKYIPFDLTITLEFEPLPGAATHSRKAIPKCEAPPVNPAALALAAAHSIATASANTATPSFSGNHSPSNVSPRKGGVSPRSTSPTLPSSGDPSSSSSYLAPSPRNRSGSSSKPYDNGNIGVGTKANPLPGVGEISPRSGSAQVSPRSGAAATDNTSPRSASAFASSLTPSNVSSPATAHTAPSKAVGRPRNKSDPIGSPNSAAQNGFKPMDNTSHHASAGLTHVAGQTKMSTGHVVYSHEALMAGLSVPNNAGSGSSSTSSRSGSYTFQQSSYSESSSSVSSSYHYQEPQRTPSNTIDGSVAGYHGISIQDDQLHAISELRLEQEAQRRAASESHAASGPIRNVYMPQTPQPSTFHSQPAPVLHYGPGSIPPNSGVPPPAGGVARNVYFQPPGGYAPAPNFTPPTGYPPGFVQPTPMPAPEYSPRKRPSSMHAGTAPNSANPYDPRNQANPYAYASNPYIPTAPSPPVNPYASGSTYSSTSSSYSSDSTAPQGWPPGYQPQPNSTAPPPSSSTPTGYPLPVYVPPQ